MSENHKKPVTEEKYQVFPFDLFTDLICCFSNQVIHLVMILECGINYEVLKKTVEMVSLAEPILRCKILREQDTLWWKEDTDWKTDDHVLLLSSRDPKELLYQALSYPLDPYRGKLFQVILIENSEGDGDLLVINAHHIVMDGKGLKDFAGLIMSMYNNHQSWETTGIQANPVGNRKFPEFSTFISEKIKNSYMDSPIGWCSGISVPVQSLDTDTYRYSVLTFSRERSAIVHAKRKEWGITVNDLMIAVTVRAIAYTLRIKSETIIPIYNTVDLRRYLSEKAEPSLMNLSTSFEVRIPIIPGESLEGTTKRVHILMNHEKIRGPGLDEAINAEILFESGYIAAKEIIHEQWKAILDSGSKTTIFSNTGIISSFRKKPDDLPVRTAFILPHHFKPPGFFLMLSTYEDTMTLSATYAHPAYDPGLVNRLFMFIDSIIPGYSSFPGDYEVLKDPSNLSIISSQ